MSVRGASGMRPRHGPQSDGEGFRLLLVRIAPLGDVLVTTPAIRCVRAALPAARIEFLTGEGGAELLEGNVHLDEILLWRPGLRAELALARELRRRRYDAVVDFECAWPTARLVLATGARLRIGSHRPGPRRFCYNRRVRRPRPPASIARERLELLRPLGIEPEAMPDLSLELAIRPEDHAWAERVIRDLALGGDAPIVAVSPVSRLPYKQWGADRWAAVADRLAGAGAQVLLTNGPGEREQVAAVVGHMRHRAAWDYGPSSLRQLAALYRRCVLWVGNDGGAMHLAVAAGTPTIGVFRWATRARWSHPEPRGRHAGIDRAPPQGCDQQCTRCVHLGCLRAVSVEEVVETALSKLAAIRSGVAASESTNRHDLPV